MKIKQAKKEYYTLGNLKCPIFIIRFFYLRKYLYIRLDGWKGSVAVGSPLVRLKPDYWITNIL